MNPSAKSNRLIDLKIANRSIHRKLCLSKLVRSQADPFNPLVASSKTQFRKKVISPDPTKIKPPKYFFRGFYFMLL